MNVLAEGELRVKRSVLTTRTWVLLIGALLLVAAGALNFAQRLQQTPPPTDGIAWAETPAGVIAERVAPLSTAARARLAAGDRVVAVSLDDKAYDEVTGVTDVQINLEQAGVGGSIHYLIERASNPAGAQHYYADLYDLQPLPAFSARSIYINLIGVVYLCVGLFVLFKQGGRAPYAMHFALVCLAAFVFHFFQPVGTIEDFDDAIAFLDAGAFALFAPLFLHFCFIYPVRRRLVERALWRRLGVALLYSPAVLLVLFAALLLRPVGEFVAASSPALARFPSAEAIGEFFRIGFLHFLIALIGGACVLVRRFATSRNTVIRQQLKWVVWGSGLAVLPFTILYGIAYLVGSRGAADESWLTDIAVVPLALIPLTFGNSVVRYRLMDVDIVVRRVAVYALTTIALSAAIACVVLFVGYYALTLDASTPAPEIAPFPFVTAVLLMAGIVIAAAPLKNFLQERTNRIFYGERYDLRRGLLDFGRTLSATTALDPLLDALVSRLQQVLSVERVAIFVEDADAGAGYRVARAAGLSREIMVPQDFREMIRTRSAATGIVRADDLESAPESTGDVPTGFVRRTLHYYVPCVVRGRLVAVIGLGRSADGALLSSEDLEVLRTVSGYVAVAIENSLLYQQQRALYQEQQERAAELETLKEFNESIVESINVGLLAVDTDGKVTRCNSALEEILGVAREQITDRGVEELFAEEFADTLHFTLGSTGWRIDRLRPLYKVRTATRRGRPLVLNIAVAPLRSDDTERHAGALVVIEDVTERTNLEEQLQQREKLSSIGLLAAGVAHEINTPLTGVSSYTQMLLGMLPETDPKHALLQKVKRQTDRAAGIVGNLLNFSRAGGAGEFGEVRVDRVLDDTLQLLEPQMRQSRVDVVRDFEPDLPVVHADAGKLQQVFTNLILNARDACPEGGTITLRTRRSIDEVSIEVSDTGTGIAPEHVARIYDPFFTTKAVGAGTGLGLAVSYGIVQEHAGHISVESRQDGAHHGTTFRITLPAAHPRRMQAAGD